EFMIQSQGSLAQRLPMSILLTDVTSGLKSNGVGMVKRMPRACPECQGDMSTQLIYSLRVNPMFAADRRHEERVLPAPHVGIQFPVADEQVYAMGGA
ncbi:MAG: hypothetical protein COZ56_10255, partial [Armatimonadetes bacterium CG_4_8_14_3_um_filter_58_9]